MSSSHEAKLSIKHNLREDNWNRIWYALIKKIVFSEQGAVHASLFDDISQLDADILNNDIRYPNNPTYSGYLDNLDTPPNHGGSTALRIWSYLVAPATGNFVFYVSGRDFMQVSLSTDASEANKRVIITRNGRTDRYQFDK